jgi:hypothetical protein
MLRAALNKQLPPLITWFAATEKSWHVEPAGLITTTNRYRAFVGVHVAGEHEVDLVLDEPRLVHHPHGLAFHVVVVVAVVPGGVHQHDQPRRLAAIHLGELGFEPLVLRSVFSWETQ